MAKLTIDLSKIPDWTLGDAEDFEDHARIPLSGLGKLDANAVPQRIITALAWISGRRSNSSFTLEDARRTSFNELEFVGADGAVGKLEEAEAAA